MLVICSRINNRRKQASVSKISFWILGLRYLGVPDLLERWLSKMLSYLASNFSNSKKFPSFAAFEFFAHFTNLRLKLWA